jgi:hypothetical protein
VISVISADIGTGVTTTNIEVQFLVQSSVYRFASLSFIVHPNLTPIQQSVVILHQKVPYARSCLIISFLSSLQLIIDSKVLILLSVSRYLLNISSSMKHRLPLDSRSTECGYTPTS